jgi:hypothetical protein
VLQPAEAEVGQHAVFAGERDDVGDGAEGRERGGVDQKRAEGVADFAPARHGQAHRPSELERDAGAAEDGVGVGR